MDNGKLFYYLLADRPVLHLTILHLKKNMEYGGRLKPEGL